MIIVVKDNGRIVDAFYRPNEEGYFELDVHNPMVTLLKAQAERN